MKKRFSTAFPNINKNREKIGIEQFLKYFCFNKEKMKESDFSNMNKIYIINKEYIKILIDNSEIDISTQYKEPFIITMQGLTKLKFEKDLHIENKTEYHKTDIILYTGESESKEYKYFLLKRNWLLLQLEAQSNEQILEFIEESISIQFTEYEAIKWINQNNYFQRPITFNILYFSKIKALCFETLIGHSSPPLTSVEFGNNPKKILEFFSHLLKNICVLDNFQLDHEYLRNSVSIIEEIGDKFLLINLDNGMKILNLMNQSNFIQPFNNRTTYNNGYSEAISTQEDFSKGRFKNTNALYYFGLKLMKCLKGDSFSDISSNPNKMESYKNFQKIQKFQNINNSTYTDKSQYSLNDGYNLMKKLYRIAEICIRNDNPNPLNANELINIFIKLNEKDFTIDLIDSFYKKMQNCKIETIAYLKQFCNTLKEKTELIEKQLFEVSSELSNKNKNDYYQQVIEQNLKMKQYIEQINKENFELQQQLKNSQQQQINIESLQFQIKEKVKALNESKKQFDDEHLNVIYLEQQLNDAKLVSQKRINEKDLNIHELQLKIEDLNLKYKNLENKENQEKLENLAKNKELEKNNKILQERYSHLKEKIKSKKEIIKTIENHKLDLQKENQNITQILNAKCLELSDYNHIIKNTLDILKIDDAILRSNISKSMNNFVGYIVDEYSTIKKKLEEADQKLKTNNKNKNQEKLQVNELGQFQSLDNNKNIHYYGTLSNGIPDGIGILFSYDFQDVQNAQNQNNNEVGFMNLFEKYNPKIDKINNINKINDNIFEEAKMLTDKLIENPIDKIWNELLLNQNNNQVICYLGEFKNGLITGTGRIIFSNKENYQGGIVNGKFNGDGTYYFKDQTKLITQFNDNMIIKGGQLIFSDGATFPNQFFNLLEIRNNYINFQPLIRQANLVNPLINLNLNNQNNYNQKVPKAVPLYQAIAFDYEKTELNKKNYF